MHSRWRRPFELDRTAPRRVLNLTQKHIANPPIEAIPSGSLPANLVVTGYIYQHDGAGGGLDLVNLGVHPTRLSGILTTQPSLDAPLAPPYGSGATGDAWLNHDKQAFSKLERHQTALANPRGFYHHVWQGSSFAGSSSTVSLRAQTEPEKTQPIPTRPIAAPVLPTLRSVLPPNYPAIFFYGPTGKPTPPSPTYRTPLTPRPSDFIPGRVAHNFYRVGTTFLRTK